jgi:hypothetical protein
MQGEELFAKVLSKGVPRCIGWRTLLYKLKDPTGPRSSSTSRHEGKGPTNHGRLIRKEIWTKSNVTHERVEEGFSLTTITIKLGRRSRPNLLRDHQGKPSTM